MSNSNYLCNNISGEKYWGKDGNLKKARKLLYRNIWKKNFIDTIIKLLDVYCSAFIITKEKIKYYESIPSSYGFEKLILWDMRYLMCGIITTLLAHAVRFVPKYKLTADQCEVVGTVFLKLRKYDHALHYMSIGVLRFDKKSPDFVKIIPQLSIMNVYLQMKETKKAEYYYKIVFDQTEKWVEHTKDRNQDHQDQLIRSLYMISKYEEETGKHSQSSLHKVLARNLENRTKISHG